MLPGVRVGRGSVIGAGSIVTKNVLPYSVVVGAPAKLIATKFTVDEILKHEKNIFNPSERMSIEYLQELFLHNFKVLSSIGENDLTNDELENIKQHIML